MEIPASDQFTPLPLASAFNRDRSTLHSSLRLQTPDGFGPQTCRGIPFEFGAADRANVILLDSDEVRIPVNKIQATYLVFAHIVEDKPQKLSPDLADVEAAAPFSIELTGNELGDLVAEYQLEYVDGSLASIPIRRRFAIQQARIGWGASPFAATPHVKDTIDATVSESLSLKRMPSTAYGNGETRHGSGRDAISAHFWLYALPNPFPERVIAAIRCLPRDERAVIYGISATRVSEHPLRPGLRRKLALTIPPSVEFNSLGELDDIDIDLGNVISARAKLEYDREAWFGDATDVQPTRSERAAIIEYAAHPKARLYLADAQGKQFTYDLGKFQQDALIEVAEARRVIKVKVVDAAGKPVAARIHLHGAAGEYLPPRGNHRRVNRYWFEDNYGEFANGRNQYAYIHGHCEVEAPLGEVFVEISRGYEIKPYRGSIEVSVASDEFVFELERALDWRERGWVTADTHVHFLSPQTALLEGAAEGVNVVNLLASQWGEMFSNVSDFDGRSTLGAVDFGGDGEFLVRVGTENRMQVMGHISLLGYSGEMIHPLCSGGPSESAIGDALEVSMADWARRCIEQNGLVVLPHAPNPQAERAADIVLELVHAIEMMSFNPYNAQITPYGLLDWYRYLNLGYQIPIVGGSDKMDAQSLLGGMRTYAHLGEREFTYDNWMESVKAGNTFVTVGPLLELQVEGLSPGSRLDMPKGGGTVIVSWRVESAAMPLERVEVVCGGLCVEERTLDGSLGAEGSCEVHISESTWIALRVRGGHNGRVTDVAAHSSCVQIRVGGGRPFHQADAIAVLEQIEGALAFVDTLAPKPEAQQFKRIRAALESAHNKLHHLMHRQGIYHDHSPLHAHDAHHEH